MTGQMFDEDPIHASVCSPDVAWSTINAGEAIPGVVTPLTWSFFGDATDRAIKQTFADLGAIGPAEVVTEQAPEGRMWDVFYGRASANLNMFRYIGDGMPGTSGDAIEEQIFGQVRPGVKSSPRYSRYPVSAVKLPKAALGVSKALRREVTPVSAFWQAAVRPGGLATPAAARAALREAHARFEAVMVPHTLAAMLCQGMYEQLRRASENAGLPGLELRLITGYGQMAETDVVSDLWEVSRDRLTIDQFIHRHGYHGPNEGELSSTIWRLDRQPVLDLLEAYRTQGEEHDPRVIERRRAEERKLAEAELLATLSRPRQEITKLVMKVAASLIPLRGTGKAGFLQCADVAREAARVIGTDLVAKGVVDRPDDAFMLTVGELLDPSLAAGTAALAGTRRSHHERYLTLDIPDLFYGVPTPESFGARAEELAIGEVITGTAVSPGLIRGRARVLLDLHADDPIQDGEILVCRTTDPSWASAMMIASALVIDIGGPISHGAIVARELGVPCAIGTRNAAKRIRTGDLIEVDGARGQVTVLERAAEQIPAVAPVSADTMPDEGDPMSLTHQLPLLRALRLKGRATAEEAGAAAGVPDAAAAVSDLLAAGLLKEMRGAYMLTPEGRAALDDLLADERAGVDADVIASAHQSFTPVNDQFKALANDWQSHDGEPNDHSDAGYDATVIARLPGIHAAVSPIVDALVGQAPRMAVYAQRLESALEKVRAGEHQWLLKPLIDSYHTVWFELHEELISLAGLNRLDEAAAGRAH